MSVGSAAGDGCREPIRNGVWSGGRRPQGPPGDPHTLLPGPQSTGVIPQCPFKPGGRGKRERVVSAGTCPRRCTDLFPLTHWLDLRQKGTAGLILGAVCSAKVEGFYSGEKGAVNTGGWGRSRPQGGIGLQSCPTGHTATAVHLGLHGPRGGGQTRGRSGAWRYPEKPGHRGAGQGSQNILDTGLSGFGWAPA